MKTLKKLTAVLLAALMLLSFTGCNAVKEMKAKQAFWEGSRSGEVIVWNGQRYILHKDAGDEWDYYGYDRYREGGYVTEKDVPALLQELYGSHYTMTADQKVMTVSYGSTYVREDVYAEFEKAMQEKPQERYFVECFIVPAMWDDPDVKQNPLTDAQAERLLDIARDSSNGCAAEEFYDKFAAEAEFMEGENPVYRGTYRPAFPEYYLEQEFIGSATLYMKDSKPVIVFFTPEDDYHHLMTDEETTYFMPLLFPEQ